MRTVLLMVIFALPVNAQSERVRAYDTWLASAESFDVAPEQYVTWWNELATAAQYTGPMTIEGMHFYILPGVHFRVPFSNRIARAAWIGAMVIAAENRWNERVIKHEMLHAMLGLEGEDSHHPPIFARLGLLANRAASEGLR